MFRYIIRYLAKTIIDQRSLRYPQNLFLLSPTKSFYLEDLRVSANLSSHLMGPRDYPHEKLLLPLMIEIVKIPIELHTISVFVRCDAIMVKKRGSPKATCFNTSFINPKHITHIFKIGFLVFLLKFPDNFPAFSPKHHSIKTCKLICHLY